MRKCYTISSLKALSELPKLDMAQFTLNSRQFPSKRKTVVALQNLTETGSTTPIIVHYDYIYIASRYGFFSDSVKKAIIDELCSILHYAEKDTNIVGIVMHTDFPLKRDIFNEAKYEKILDSYSSSIWNKQSIADNYQNAWTYSLSQFLSDIHKEYQSVPRIKIYLENTTKIGPNDEGDIYSIVDFFEKHPVAYHYFGICYDTEHHFAIHDGIIPADVVETIHDGIAPVLVHINAIPSNVTPGSGLDRHSDTTIQECSFRNKDYYMTYAGRLDYYGIPWVREVHTETMFRELEQLGYGK